MAAGPVRCLLLTKAGLWIASDNFTGGGGCGGIHSLAGVCFLPK